MSRDTRGSSAMSPRWSISSAGARSTPPPGPSHRRVCSWQAHRAPARLCWPGPSRARPPCRSSQSPGPASSSSTSGLAPPGCGTCSPRLASGRRRSSSSKKLTPSASAGAPASPATTNGSRPSTNSWPRWTASSLPRALSSWPRPTGRKRWTPRCCGPGRFDRQVVVPLPTQPERRAILAVHARGKMLAADVDLDATARLTPGFSGADLAHLLNEAAIVAVRDGRQEITAADLSQARDRTLLGQRQDTNFLLESEKRNVAVHEPGHALVAAFSPEADPVDRVTILPSGMALGVTEQLPEEERHLYSLGHMTTSLAVRLGGRAAELVLFGEGSTGASNDLAGATALATRMVREFGLSPALGPVGYGSATQQYLGDAPLTSRSYSEETQRVIDTEVARLLREAEATAVDLLRTHRDALDSLTRELLEHEMVNGDVVRSIAAGSWAGDDGHGGTRHRPAPTLRG